MFRGAADHDLVHVDDLVVMSGSGAQRLLDPAIFFDHFLGLFDGGGLALDVREDRIDLRSLAQDLGFEAADKTVRVDERHVFVQFHVQFNMQLAVMRLHAEIVHGYIVSCGHGAHAVEDAFSPALAGNRVNDDVGLGQRAMHSFSGGADQFAGVLKGVAARQGKREVGEVVRPGAPHARLLHRQHAGNLLGFANDPQPRLRRNLVHQHADGFARQLRGDAQNHERYEDGGDRIGVAQPVNVERSPSPRRQQAQQDRQGSPDVRGEMEGIGGKRRRTGLLGHAAQFPRTPEVNGDRSQQDQHGPDGIAQFKGVAA